MKLLTQEIKQQLPKLYSQDEVEDPMVVVKFFTPDSSWTWLILEGSEQENGDWMFFCQASSHLCHEGELGYVMLSELEQIRGALGLEVERDLYFSPKKLSECK